MLISVLEKSYGPMMKLIRCPWPWQVQDPGCARELPEPSGGEPPGLREFHAGARGPQRTA